MEIKDVEFDMVGYLESRFGHASRHPGLHASQIYGDLDRILNKARYQNEFGDEELGAFAAVGFLWERVLEVTLADLTIDADPARYYRPGEMEMDGVHLTPDYADLDFYGDGSNVLGLEEWKACWKSVKKFDDPERHFWRWLVQQKIYCRALGTNVARLRALFLVGDWRASIVPTCRVKEFTFTDQELEENWNMILGHARRRQWLKPTTNK